MVRYSSIDSSVSVLVGLATLASQAIAKDSGQFGWASTQPAVWQCQYEGEVPPEQAAPAWSGDRGANTDRRIEQGVLRVVDRGTEGGNLHCYARHWQVDPDEGGVVEARVKLVDNDGQSGACLCASDGRHEVGLTFYPDRIAIESLKLAWPMRTTDDFHVYRIAIRRDDFLVLVDGKPAIDGTGRHVHPSHRGRNCVMFGSISSPAKSECLWDYVRYSSFALVHKPPRVSGAEDVVIYKKEGVYACFPSLVRLEDGALVTHFGTRVRRSHIDGTGGGATRVSRDGGRTWQPAEGMRVVEPDWRCKDGSLVRAGANGWREVPEDRRSEFEKLDVTVRSVRPGVVAYLQGAFVSRSTDGGKSWKREEIALPAHRSLMGYNDAARCVLSSGVRLTAVYGELHEDTSTRVFALRSADDGRTWWFLPLAADAAGEIDLNETALIENDGGRVIAMIRSESSCDGHLYQSVSDDRGITWTPPHKTEIWGYPAHLLKLRDGRILCTYGYRRGAMGVRAVLSRDGGLTWDTGHILVIRNDGTGNGGDIGYPLSVETTPGEVFTIYYITLNDGITHAAGTIWSVPQP